MSNEKAIAEKKERILELARKIGIEQDCHDYIIDLVNTARKLVELEKFQ